MTKKEIESEKKRKLQIEKLNKEIELFETDEEIIRFAKIRYKGEFLFLKLFFKKDLKYTDLEIKDEYNNEIYWDTDLYKKIEDWVMVSKLVNNNKI